MSFKPKDVITFADQEKVVVLVALMHDQKEYLFVNSLDAQENFTDQFKVLKANYEDGTLEKVVDKDLLMVLMPKFQKLLDQE